MKFRYKFDLKFQALYGLITAAASFALLFLILNRQEWLTAGIIGIGSFVVSGFYTDYYRKQKC